MITLFRHSVINSLTKIKAAPDDKFFACIRDQSVGFAKTPHVILNGSRKRKWRRGNHAAARTARGFSPTLTLITKYHCLEKQDFKE